MRTVIDITDDTSASTPADDGWPEPALIRDQDMGVAIVLGDVELVMTIGQFDSLYRAAAHWWTRAGSDREQDLADGVDLPHPPPPEGARPARRPRGKARTR